MKKTLLLAGVACLVSSVASAQDYNLKPYVGLDYAYDKAKLGGEASSLDDSFNSGIINVGSRFNENFGLEAFYQMADENKEHIAANEIKTKFSAYGLDAYGYMPMGCDKKVDLLGSVGLANYDLEVKGADGKHTQDKIGYRFGLGAQYNFTEQFAARVMARYSYIGADSVNNLQEVTAGVRYTF